MKIWAKSNFCTGIGSSALFSQGLSLGEKYYLYKLRVKKGF